MILATLFHRDRKEFPEYFLHHICTITLVSYSYFTNVIPIGAAVMLIMDCSDIFVSLFKLGVDVSDKLQMPGFLLMFSTWTYLRMWFYPIYLIKEIWVQANATGHPV
jgi:ceramide synthetase